MNIELNGIDCLRDIKRTCIDNYQSCELCPYADKNEPCLIYDITHSFPDKWTIKDVIDNER